MFNDNKNLPENDPLKGKFDGIDKELRAPAALKQAAKTGVPLRKNGAVSTSVHVRRFGKAVAAYAMGIMLFLGVVAVLPGLWESDPISSPGMNVTTTDAITDGTDSSVPPENSDSADVTDTPPIDQTPDTEDNSDQKDGQWVDFGTVCYSFDELCQLYEILQRQNHVPTVIPNLDNAENAWSYYIFKGGPVYRPELPRGEYDYPFPMPRFGFEMFVGLEGDYPRKYTFDAAIYGECHILDEPIAVSENVQIQMIDQHYDGGPDNMLLICRDYEFYQDGVCILTVEIATPKDNDLDFDQICEMLKDNLVSMG